MTVGLDRGMDVYGTYSFFDFQRPNSTVFSILLITLLLV